MEGKGTRLIANILITIYTLRVILAIILHFANIDFYYFGLALTILYQIVQVVIDLRRQYKEAIRYQEMQRELYEAKVGVMVSQIQPHFIYKACSSITLISLIC